MERTRAAHAKGTVRLDVTNVDQCVSIVDSYSADSPLDVIVNFAGLHQPHVTGNVVFCDDGYNIEGHSWPEGNIALERLYASLEDIYPRSEAVQPGEEQ